MLISIQLPGIDLLTLINHSSPVISPFIPVEKTFIKCFFPMAWPRSNANFDKQSQ